jgi:hypothetical protein
MAVNLGDRITDLLQELNPPGQTLVTMTDDEALSRLVYAFWDMRLAGVDFLANYTCSDGGIITPTGGASPGTSGTYIPGYWYTDSSGDLGREVQAAIVLFAGWRALLTQYQNLKTMTRSQAGNVSFETQQSATVLQSVLKAVTAKIDIVLTRFSDLGSTTVTVLDSVIDATINVLDGDSWWIRGSYGDDRWGPGY